LTNIENRNRRRSRLFEIALITILSFAVLFFAYAILLKGLVPNQYLLSFYAAIILVDGYLAVRLAGVMIEHAIRPTLGVTRTQGIKNFVQLLAAMVVLVAVLDFFGVNLTGLLVGAGFLGIVLGLAAQQVLGNIFAGFAIFFSRPFEIGDRITLVNSNYSLLSPTYSHEQLINGFTGTVQDTGLFFTRILLDEGTPSVFPNSVVTLSLIINHTLTSTRFTRVRANVDRRVPFAEFKSRLLQYLEKYDKIDVKNSRVEIVDLTDTSYQVVVIASSRSPFEEPIKTLIIQETLNVEKELTPAP
jgi:small-conductance mechanosensitive channel